jgi:hypothetical protein
MNSIWIIPKKFQECTVQSGYTGAQWHSGLLGWGPAAWPGPAAFGSLCQSERDLVWRSTVSWNVNGDKVFGTSILTTLATRRYTHTSTAMTGEGCSPKRCVARRQRSTSTRTNESEVDEDLWARFLSCISVPWGLGAWRRTLLLMKSSRESSHRWRAESLMWSTVASGGVDQWSSNLGQNDHKEARISYVEGIAQWQSQPMVSGGWSSPRRWGKKWQKRKLRLASPFL